MSKPNQNVTVGTGAAYLYIESIASALLGYIFWIILFKIASPETIGTVSTIVSISSIVSSASSLGIAAAIPRFLGVSFLQTSSHDSKVLIIASALLLSFGVFSGIVFIFIARDSWILGSLGLNLVILLIVLTSSTSYLSLFRSVIIASLRTKAVVVQQLVGSGLRILLAVFFAMLGMGAVGITFSYTFGQVVAMILTTLSTRKLLNTSTEDESNLKLLSSAKEILTAGVSSWLPIVISSIGSQSGTIVVFGTIGAAHASNYFVSYTIITAIITVTSSLLAAAFPALSAMKDGRKKYTWRIIKLSLVLSMPISAILFLYSNQILDLLGERYIEAASSLRILSLSVLPTIFITGLTTLVYAYGNYRQVLAIGLVSSVPRTILYFILVPLFGSAGAAISFTVGSLAGFAISFIIMRRIKMSLIWRDLLFVIIVPFGASLLMYAVGISYIVAFVLVVVISLILFLRLNVLNKRDMHESLGILPSTLSVRSIKVVDAFAKFINHYY